MLALLQLQNQHSDIFYLAQSRVAVLPKRTDAPSIGSVVREPEKQSYTERPRKDA